METIKFDPNVAELQAIVAVTSKITADDLSDDVQLALVHDTRISLRDARVKIEKTGKALRADALKYQKDVIAREKELLGIILPEEDRLADIEDEAKEMKERAARVALLPMRKEQLAKFEDVIDDEAILYLDNDEFVAYLVELQGKKNEADRLENERKAKELAEAEHLAQVRKDAEVAERNRIEADQKADLERKIQEEARKMDESKVAAQKLIDDAKAAAAKVEETARLEREAKAAAAQKLIDDAKAEAERLVAVAKAQEEARVREIVAREEQAKTEAAAREQDAKYQAWLTQIGFKDEDWWHFEEAEGHIRAYKYVASFI